MSRIEADIVIRGGTVIDGTGATPVEADIALAGGRILAVGPGLDARGAEEIDAKGRIVTPGFVDIHTHYDGQAVWDSHLAPSALHGVTTAVMGNCGVGFAPVKPGGEATLIELMEGVEDIPGPVLAEGLDFRWNSFADYMDVLDAKPRDIDICALVPHAAVRVYVMGERALALENANQADIAQMRDIVAEAVRAGAFGFSTSRTISHKTLKGDFTPTLRAQEEELSGIAEGLRSVGAGFLEVVSDFNQPDPETEFALIRRVAEKAGRPMVFTLTARHDRTEHWKILLGLSNKAAAEGVNIRPVFPPRAVGILMGLQGSQNPFSGTPSYKAIAHLPLESRVAAMRDPEVRARITTEDRFEGSNFALIRRILWDRMFPFSDPPDYTPAKENSIAAQAEREGRRPEEVAYDMLIADQGHSFIYCALTNYQNWDLAPSAELLKHPNTIVGLSDGGAHVGFISDASFQTFLLSHWGRDRKDGRVPVQELVRRLTSDTARAAGLKDRGMLRPGLRADVNIIDFDRLRLHRPDMRHDLPAGGRRLVQRADGYVATIQSGQVTYREGTATGALPGRLVRCSA
jgi:N-acyl-D-aspartate/D-glutamate deacylase